MSYSFMYLLLSVFSLSFLIFIHELGHYYMARRLGMQVEVFSIGFGRALYSWIHRGVKWQVGWLPFGGYVKISGLDGEGKNQEEEGSSSSFSQHSPLDRIKVAVMGPAANLLFAFGVFVVLSLVGGREKNFSEYTKKIGWIDPASELYLQGVRPGDEITSYNGVDTNSSKEHMTAPMLSSGELLVEGNYVDPYSKEKTPFKYFVHPYLHPNSVDKEILTVGVLHPASYVFYAPGESEPSLVGSPMEHSGILPGDRIVWMDGVPIYSLTQVGHVLNDHKTLLTIRRGDDLLLRRVPRVPVEELRIEGEAREEVIDWQHEAELQGKMQKLLMIPYNLNNQGVVEGRFTSIDREMEKTIFPEKPFSTAEVPLQVGDKIVAVDGVSVQYSYQILAALQEKRVMIVVQRGGELLHMPLSSHADELFDQQYAWSDVKKLTSQIGFSVDRDHVGSLHLLKPVIPKTRQELSFFTQDLSAVQVRELYEKELAGIEDPEKKAQVLRLLQERDEQLLLGLPAIQDQKIRYNPAPTDLFMSLLEEIWQTLKALVTGMLSPKWMAGPIGMVEIMQSQSMGSWREGLYWLGNISLNLGILNLLPLPVLDGGTILFSAYELGTGRRIRMKTLERLILPFAFALLGLLLFLTYNDLLRIMKRFF